MKRLLFAGLGLGLLLGIGIAWAAGPYLLSATQAPACVAVNAEPTAAINGQWIAHDCTLSGKQIVAPYANKENYVSGAASATGTGATTIIAAGGSGVKLYITSVQCYRSDAGTTAAYVTLDDGASTIVVLPNGGGGGGATLTLPIPLVVAANTAFTFTASTSLTTVYCSGQGFKGA